MTGLLALFDVDGTLFLTHDPLVGRAVVETLREAYEVELPNDAIAHVDHRGQTTKRIGRLILEQHGVDAIGLDAWCARTTERYLELLAGADTSGWEARPGSAEALAELEAAGIRLALLTGNPEPVARARMERLGLARFFPAGQGAFGCEAEERDRLIELALERAGASPVGAVEIGDTRRDRTTALAAGVGSLVVGPDDDLRAVARALLS